MRNRGQTLKLVKSFQLKELMQLSKNDLAALMKLVSTARSKKYLRRKIKKYGNLSRALSEEQLHRFFDSFKPNEYRYKIACLTQFFCGLRAGEMLAIKDVDIDIKNQLIRIQTEKSATIDFVKIPNVFFPVFLEYLLRYEKRIKKKNGFVFFSEKSSGPWVSQRFRAVFGKVRKRAGLDFSYGKAESLEGKPCHRKELYQFTSHSLRHTYATFLVKGIKDVSLVSKLLRHKKLDSTMVYLHHNQNEMAEAIDKVFTDRLIKEEPEKIEIKRVAKKI